VKKRIILSAIIAAAALIAYPFLEHLGNIERGYGSKVFGGEEFTVIFFVVVIPLLLISHGTEKRRDERNREIEQEEAER
jgi:hypothetical protein